MTQLDEAKMEEFAGRMMDVLNVGMVPRLPSTGHQVGLFEAMADRPPSSSDQIADAAGLNERYVR